jgi:signal transduction histidine kinase
MLNAAERMQILLDALLNYARISSRAEPFTEVDLNGLVEEVLWDLEARIEETGGHVEIGILPTIGADPNQMRQLFQNLIENGLKYHGEAKPHVKVYEETNNSSYRICVDDNGIGFDERDLDKIFQPFQRLHGRSSGFEGTGMGLAICRKIVERHGGSITTKSRPGKGSSFIVTLPIKQTSSVDLNGQEQSQAMVRSR